MNVLEPPFFFTFHLKRALFEFSSLPLSFSLFSSSSFFSKLAQARSPQLDVRLRPAPPRHRRLDRAVGLRGRDVNVVVELFVVSFFLSDFGGERGVSEEKKKKARSLSKKKKKKKKTYGAVDGRARQKVQVRQPQVHGFGVRDGSQQPLPHLEQRKLQRGRIHPSGRRTEKRGPERRERFLVALVVVARAAVPPRGRHGRGRDALSSFREARERVPEEALVARHRRLEHPPALDAGDDPRIAAADVAAAAAGRSRCSCSSSSSSSSSAGGDDLSKPPPGTRPAPLVGLEAVRVLPAVDADAGPARRDDADFRDGDEGVLGEEVAGEGEREFLGGGRGRELLGDEVDL